MLSNFITDKYTGGMENHYTYEGAAENNNTSYVIYGIIIGSLLFLIVLRLHLIKTNNKSNFNKKYQSF